MKKLLFFIISVAMFGQLSAQNPYKDLGIKENEIEFLTLSKGRYDEFHGYKDYERVGSAIIDMRTNKIARFVNKDSIIDEAMYEFDMTTRFLTIDPMAEKYNQLSPYAYCANNPIVYIDPTGMYIEEGSQKEWESRKSDVTSQRDYLQKRVDKLTAKAAAKGWSAEKLANRIGDKSERAASLNSSLGTMGTLESSTQGYSLSHTASGENGGVTLNTETNIIDIKFGSGNTANFVHEATHAGQFEKGDMAFDSKSGMTLAQDIHDEVSAYKAQYAYDPSSISGLPSTSYANSFGTITTSWVQGLAGGTLYAPGGTANTGVGPININSTRADFINAYPNNPAMRTLPANFILKNSYPNIYFKK